ncbi:hypothetical protein, partial [Tenacibaculum finnmarkense]
MFWTTKKKVPKKIKTLRETLQEYDTPMWKNKFLLEIETKIQTPYLGIKDKVRTPHDTITT